MNPERQHSFASLRLDAAQLKNLASLNYESMTPIQAASLPAILDGKDVVAKAKTGSGKTAAFGLGLLQALDPRSFNVQALILCPTRELADQVGKELRRLAQGISNIKLLSLCGGKPFGPQKLSLRHGGHIVVGTPGRVLDHLERGSLKLSALRVLVLDEADRMLDMGFSDTMTQIIAHSPRNRQTLLFSATYPNAIADISRSIQRQPIIVEADTEHSSEAIDQVFYEVSKHERNNALVRLFQHYKPAAALVFCHTKVACSEVAALLNDQGIAALPLHGDLEQRQRDRVLIRFANASIPVVVATDVAARGLDIKDLPLVINYELPRDPEIYVHRIGRTGRAGAKGRAVSLYTQGEQVRVNAIEAYTGEPCICDVPESLDTDDGYKLTPAMTTIEFAGGRKQKIRAGDLLGALTQDAGLEGRDVGKIDILDMASFVALKPDSVRQALNALHDGKVKGRNMKVRKLR